MLNFQITDYKISENSYNNFGYVTKKGRNNVYFRLKKMLEPKIVGTVCVTHIAHNRVQSAVDVYHSMSKFLL